MKFLVDAQLPRRLARWLSEQEHDVIHTFDLPERNQTTDAAITELSMEQSRVVISKDADFVNSFLVKQEPYKLLLVSTGNITNNDLLLLFERNLEQIVECLENHDFVEINQSVITIHS